jgi:hypothetical protein
MLSQFQPFAVEYCVVRSLTEALSSWDDGLSMAASHPMPETRARTMSLLRLVMDVSLPENSPVPGFPGVET